MLLCYLYVQTSTGIKPQLSVIADKPDLISLPVPVEELIVTDSAIIRVGPGEALKVAQDPKGGVVLSALTGAKLFLTPDLSDRPGVIVKFIRLTKVDDHFEVYFRQEKDGPNDWRKWQPNEAVG